MSIQNQYTQRQQAQRQQEQNRIANQAQQARYKQVTSGQRQPIQRVPTPPTILERRIAQRQQEVQRGGVLGGQFAEGFVESAKGAVLQPSKPTAIGDIFSTTGEQISAKLGGREATKRYEDIIPAIQQRGGARLAGELAFETIFTIGTGFGIGQGARAVAGAGRIGAEVARKATTAIAKSKVTTVPSRETRLYIGKTPMEEQSIFKSRGAVGSFYHAKEGKLVTFGGKPMRVGQRGEAMVLNIPKDISEKVLLAQNRPQFRGRLHETGFKLYPRKSFSELGEGGGKVKDVSDFTARVLSHESVHKGLSRVGTERASGLFDTIFGKKGYKGTVSHPTVFLAGEAGDEYVSIKPLKARRKNKKNLMDFDFMNPNGDGEFDFMIPKGKVFAWRF